MACNDNNNDFAVQDQKINDFLKNVKYKMLIMSGKGGVGKSTVATNLALALSEQGYKVGLLDVDVHGPSIAGLLGLTGIPTNVIDDVIQPYWYSENLSVVTIQGMLDNPDRPIIWRGPMKIGFIRQFLADVNWGALDFLIVDSPPGTGDEPLTIAQTIPDCNAVIVTTPQEIALSDVRKSVNFCYELKMNVVGVIENMSGFICPECKTRHDIFKTGGAEKMAQKMGLVVLGKLPIDPMVVEFGDLGKNFLEGKSPAVQEMKAIAGRVLHEVTHYKQTVKGEKNLMNNINGKVALPLVGGLLSSHFGHCEKFAFYTIEGGKIVQEEEKTPPPHAPGVIPNWLADEGCTVLLAGGIGEGAVSILKERNVELVAGVEADKPAVLIESFLAGELTDKGAVCQGGHNHGQSHGCGGGCGH